MGMEKDIKEYFKKFYDMKPYIYIDKDEWKYIINTFEKDDIVDTLSEVLVTYPPPIPNITEKKTLDDSEYVECFGMEMAKRPNCIGIGNAKVTEESNRQEEYVIEKEGDTFAEPVWVWKKK